MTPHIEGTELTTTEYIAKNGGNILVLQRLLKRSLEGTDRQKVRARKTLSNKYGIIYVKKFGRINILLTK